MVFKNREWNEKVLVESTLTLERPDQIKSIYPLSPIEPSGAFRMEKKQGAGLLSAGLPLRIVSPVVLFPTGF